MILTPQYKYTRSDGVRMYYTKSPNDVKIRKVGTDEIYTDAYDVEAKVQQGLTYEETDIPIEQDEPATDTEQKAEAFDYLTGAANE